MKGGKKLEEKLYMVIPADEASDGQPCLPKKDTFLRHFFIYRISIQHK
jgi:hypothetical protein